MGSSASISKKNDVITPQWETFLAGVKAEEEDAGKKYKIACENENNAVGDRRKEQCRGVTESK